MGCLRKGTLHWRSLSLSLSEHSEYSLTIQLFDRVLVVKHRPRQLMLTEARNQSSSLYEQSAC